jgi:hypothetical protein
MNLKVFLTLTPLLLGAALAATAGEFTVLTMNVAGLPAILNSNDVPGDKATNAASIGTLFAKYNYDVVHVQEVRLVSEASSLLRTCKLTRVLLVGLQLPCIPLLNRQPSVPNSHLWRCSVR